MEDTSHERLQVTFLEDSEQPDEDQMSRHVGDVRRTWKPHSDGMAKAVHESILPELLALL